MWHTRRAAQSPSHLRGSGRGAAGVTGDGLVNRPVMMGSGNQAAHEGGSDQGKGRWGLVANARAHLDRHALGHSRTTHEARKRRRRGCTETGAQAECVRAHGVTIPTPPHAGECTRTCAHTHAHESACAHTPKEDQETAHHTIHCGNQPASIRRRSLSTPGRKSANRVGTPPA